MNQPVKHHYVPQSVLRRFSSDGNRLFVFDKHTDRSFPSSVRDAGSENNFHTVEVNGEQICFEGLFQHNDDQLGSLLNDVAAARSVAHVSTNARTALSAVVAVQVLRTKMIRTSIRSMAEGMADLLRQVAIDPKQVHGAQRPDEQDIRRAALDAIRNSAPQLVGELNNKQLLLVHNADAGCFWISDNPVVIENPFPYGDRGIGAAGSMLCFPIARDLQLLFMCPSIELKLRQTLSDDPPSPQREQLAQVLHGLRTGEAVGYGANAVGYFNMLQVGNSSRFLYAQTDEFDEARTWLRQQPGARDGQSLVRIGTLGKGPPRRSDMPAGQWAVFFSGADHYMLPIDHWASDSVFIEFQTSELQTLAAIVAVQPIEEVRVYEDGVQLRHMREVQIKVAGSAAPAQVTVSHRNEALNGILQSIRGRRQGGNG